VREPKREPYGMVAVFKDLYETWDVRAQRRNRALDAAVLVDTSEALVTPGARLRAFPAVRTEYMTSCALLTALISPANKWIMNGGIDLAYRNFFGIEIERTVQTRIKEVAGNYLPVGQAILVKTGHDRIPHLISAPTMFIPEPIDAEHCQLAMAAALKVALANPAICTTVFCPGMAREWTASLRATLPSYGSRVRCRCDLTDPLCNRSLTCTLQSTSDHLSGMLASGTAHR
jgi:hypothetical protein